MFWKVYLICIALIIITASSAQMIMNHVIKSKEKDGLVINLAGRQRMLSQKITKLSLLIDQAPTQQEQKVFQAELAPILAEWKTVHNGLIMGDTTLGLPGNNSPLISQHFGSIQPYFQKIAQQGKVLLKPNLTAEKSKLALAGILDNEAQFLDLMNQIVFQYEDESNQKLNKLRTYGKINHAVLILVIFLEILFLIRPAMRHLKLKTDELKQVNATLEDKNLELEEKNEAISKQNEDFQRINKALLEAKERAEIAAVTKAQFLSNMSHEIRTPMNAVVGLTHILLESSPREDQLEDLNTLKFSANNLLAIINDILDLSKIEEGKISFEHIDFNLKHLLLNIQSTLMLKASEKGLNFTVDIEEQVPLMLIGDPVRLSQILINLANNAIKFTEEGQVKIRISLRKMIDEEAMIFFEVIDTGIGIAKEKQEIIFNSFTQADANTTRLFGGTGLGLTITKKLIELQGGHIAVESEPGKGARFYFCLVLPISKNINLKGKETIKLLEEYNLNNPKRILLVEDYKVNQIVAEKFFKRWEMEYDVANNGLEAINLIKQNDYGLILMDLQMPEMDGYEATKVIRRMDGGTYAQLPIVALSASAMLEIKQRALDIGMDDFISKPFKPKELYNTIAKFVET
jgi:signal transduction histidine kinase/ActR/RegA family two-component response regulator